ncbi:MAG: RagB/SusD family nutrient uptake outer membrane protein, partial [Prevotella sp.]
ALDTDKVYTTKAGMNAIVNSCYENVYYMYGKVDGIDLMEMGTDLWKNGGRNSGHGDLTNYNENLTPSSGVIKTVWNSLYAIVGYCNTAIAYQDKGTDFDFESIKPKVAEAYFLRGFANFHIVEQWGGVVLQTESLASSGVSSEMGIRSSEEDFYDLIISDLKFAAENLPLEQGERGRVSRKAAIGMLAKAYLQRTRLYEEGSAERKKYADLAFQTATELIDNASQYICGLYASTATKSGDAQMWDDDNNKNNKEVLFTEAIDHVTGNNPEWWNRGRTCQYYMMNIGSQAQTFGVNAAGLRYGRANATVWTPTYYLLTECFEPKLQKNETNTELIGFAKNKTDVTPDTRFEQAFYYKYYAAAQTTLTQDILKRYKKGVNEETGQFDETLYKQYFNTVAKRRIAKAGLKGIDYNIKYPGKHYYATSGDPANQLLEDENVADGLAVYTPNWVLDTLETTKSKRLAVGVDNQYELRQGQSEPYGGRASYTYFRSLQPSWKKWRAFKYTYTNQYCMMDIPILRLTDIYLIAAEASIVAGYPQNGLQYLNAVRRHAAVAGDASAMDVTLSEMTIDYILKERARELCGEQWRWYDLKRTGRLTAEYLTTPGMNPYITTFNNNRHIVRPIPQQFLDQIANPDEFGTNGY